MYGVMLSVLPLPGHRYLAVHIESASRLKATDKAGTTDAFFSIDWDGLSQRTKPVFRCLDPIFDTTLYFPVRMLADSIESLDQKPDITVNCFDYDEAGNDFIGSCVIPLHKITSSLIKEHDDKV